MSKKPGILTRIAHITTTIIRVLVTPDELSVSEDTEKAKAEVKALIAARSAHSAHITAVVARGVTRKDFTTDMLRAIALAVQSNHNPNDARYHEVLKTALPPDGSNDLVALYLKYSVGDLNDLLVRLRHDAAAMFSHVDMVKRRQNGATPSPAD